MIIHLINNHMVIKYNEEEFKKVCLEAESMAKAAAELGLHFNTFKRHAKLLDVYNTNQAGKGITKRKRNDRYPLEDILNGCHPQYSTYKLKLRLLKKGIKSNICENCGVDSWDGKPLNMELDHIDGNRTNHKLSNLRMVCPNCHSQTETFRARNKSLNREID